MVHVKSETWVFDDALNVVISKRGQFAVNIFLLQLAFAMTSRRT